MALLYTRRRRLETVEAAEGPVKGPPRARQRRKFSIVRQYQTHETG
jgi:hypothetical protein